MLKIFLLNILFSFSVIAQVNNEKNISFEKVSATKLNKTIFGYLPWWEYLQGSSNYIRYDLISHLAIFSFEADSLGNLKDPLNWPWNDVIANASKNKVKLIISVTNFNSNEIHKLFNDKNVRTNLFKNIETRIRNYNFVGINIDFENVKDEDKNLVITNFFVELKKYFSQSNLELSFASPSINFGGWNFESLVQVCDYLFVMCYDYYGSWNDFTAPSSPFTGTYFNVSKTFENDYSNIVKAQPEKLIMGVPYYGNYWKTKTKDPYTKVDTSKSNKEWVNTLTYKQIANDYFKYEKLWDSFSQTPWIRWFDTKWNQIWYDDEKSLEIKYDYANQKKLKGVGIWALGYDGQRKELWQLIENKFTSSTDINENILPYDFTLYQNYPNPFNSETIIKYSVPDKHFFDEKFNSSKKSDEIFVTLKLYDFLGREIATLVNEFHKPGIYNLPFNTLEFKLTSGVYFYQLITDNKTITKKMILLR
ncbi:MAG: glycosyl hydrolase family 18 protein [Melioribacteraceae bacterium]|nr:glycosyl hydrolase family 18 protein [Melioribacteraceae bacterium]